MRPASGCSSKARFCSTTSNRWRCSSSFRRFWVPFLSSFLDAWFVGPEPLWAKWVLGSVAVPVHLQHGRGGDLDPPDRDRRELADSISSGNVDGGVGWSSGLLTLALDRRLRLRIRSPAGRSAQHSGAACTPRFPCSSGPPFGSVQPERAAAFSSSRSSRSEGRREGSARSSASSPQANRSRCSSS